MFLFTLIPILFIIMGAIGVFFPRISWYLSVGWQFKNAEPSTAALVSARIGGIFAIVAGIFILTSGIFPK
ncbi:MULTISPECIES: DUF6199 family natural product biosynthesis protein [Cohnella]|uniref:DUF6199 domain-containing protein n=1 Tax=Cohnella phaseoli TaxID=456490 RepID=A0A3D9JMN8_9BACL|nr:MULTISPECIES: DUF6199 family natural product biosynthesis protein [Cohnella]RED75039.1 hypothetical protein DFP98_11711 [Cohnella phaseoli]